MGESDPKEADLGSIGGVASEAENTNDKIAPMDFEPPDRGAASRPSKMTAKAGQASSDSLPSTVLPPKKPAGLTRAARTNRGVCDNRSVPGRAAHASPEVASVR